MMYMTAMMYSIASVRSRRSSMQINIVDVRSRLADTINRVRYQGERVVLKRRGKGVAALVSMEDLAELERHEDEQLVDEALAAEAAWKASGQKGIPVDQAERILDANRAR